MIPPALRENVAAAGGEANRISRGLRQLKRAWATWVLLIALIVIQAIAVLWDLADPVQGKMRLAQEVLGLSQITYLSGSPWQPLTYALIHADWYHLLVNAACILLLGSKLEHIVSRMTFWLLTLYSSLAGGAMFLVFSPFSEIAPQTLVGSSAICFGFLILLTTLSPDSKFMPLLFSGRSIGVAIILTNFLLTLLNPALPTGPLARWGEQLVNHGLDGLFQISHACHLGGSLAGFIYGRYLLRPRISIASLQRARKKREAAAVVRD